MSRVMRLGIYVNGRSGNLFSSRHHEQTDARTENQVVPVKSWISKNGFVMVEVDQPDRRIVTNRG